MPQPGKTTKTNAPVPTQAASKDTFFRKPGEGFFDRSKTLFGSQKSKPFFSPAVQPKLSVNEPGDTHEKEADAVADKVMRMPVATPVALPAGKKDEELQAKEEENIVETEDPVHEPPVITPLQRKEEDEEKLQAKSEGIPDVTPSFEQGLQSSKGGGSPLPDGVQQQMETGIGADFSSVRGRN